MFVRLSRYLQGRWDQSTGSRHRYCAFCRVRGVTRVAIRAFPLQPRRAAKIWLPAPPVPCAMARCLPTCPVPCADKLPLFNGGRDCISALCTPRAAPRSSPCPYTIADTMTSLAKSARGRTKARPRPMSVPAAKAIGRFLLNPTLLSCRTASMPRSLNGESC